MSKITIELLKKRKAEKQKITMLTAYDFTTAKIIDSCGIDVILIGDSLGNVVQGNETTLSVTIEEMIYHTKAVNRGVKNAFILADMPFLSYQASERDAILNAGNLLKLGGANGVKIEGGSEAAQLISKLSKIGIPVAGHIGLTPQYINSLSGYKVQGKSLDKIKELVDDGLALQEAGAFCIILECIPAEAAGIITEKLDIPTIGIGAGKFCDGQVLVINDILGLSGDFRPKFVKQYVNLNQIITEAVNKYKTETTGSDFPDAQHSFALPPELIEDIKLEYESK